MRLMLIWALALTTALAACAGEVVFSADFDDGQPEAGAS